MAEPLVVRDAVRVTTDGARRVIELRPMTVANFHAAALDAMVSVEMPVSINPMPNDIADAVPFPDDHEHASYVPDQAQVWWRALVQAERVFSRFRAG